MPVNFKVEYLEKWQRLEEKGIVDDERPHVIPITVQAVDFMEEFAKQSGSHAIFGGFYDPISILQTEGGPIKAFRFKSMEPEQESFALAKAETRFRLWLDQKNAAHMRVPGSRR